MKGITIVPSTQKVTGVTGKVLGKDQLVTGKIHRKYTESNVKVLGRNLESTVQCTAPQTCKMLFSLHKQDFRLKLLLKKVRRFCRYLIRDKAA